MRPLRQLFGYMFIKCSAAQKFFCFQVSDQKQVTVPSLIKEFVNSVKFTMSLNGGFVCLFVFLRGSFFCGTMLYFE